MPDKTRLKLNKEKYTIEAKLRASHVESRLNEENKAIASIKKNSKIFLHICKKIQ